MAESRTLAKPVRTRISVSVLQGEIRNRFLNLPTVKALAHVLKSVGMYFGAEYTVVHARLGVHLLSEEWCQDSESFDNAQRVRVSEAMLEAVQTGTAKYHRIDGPDGEDVAILSAPMVDEPHGQVGAMSMMISNCDRGRAMETLTLIESISGYMALMIAADISHNADNERALDPSIFAIESHRADGHPTHLAITIVNELTNHFDIGLAAIGFVQANRVHVAAISGLDEVRAPNPGVLLIRAAMEECYDRGETVLLTGILGEREVEDDHRLHSQWSHAANGDAVASFPLFLQGEIIAIVSVRNSVPQGLTKSLIEKLAAEMASYGPMLALCRIASRGLVSHVLESISHGKDRLLGGGSRKTLIKMFIAACMLFWLFFGSLTYSFTVPCMIRATEQRVISCPRDGVLADLFVRPGDRVRAGQLIAMLNDQEDVLRRHSIKAEIDTLDALIDKALEDRDSGQIRIHKAQKRTLTAQLAEIEQNIKSAQIRAPHAGVILEGDLREKLGSRLRIGEAMFTLAGRSDIAIVLEIPEHLILDARKSQSVAFASSANPEERIELSELKFAPSGTVVDGMNVFLAESVTTSLTSDLTPGMEGYAHLDIGPRAPWWVLSHRILNWFRLRFWV